MKNIVQILLISIAILFANIAVAKTPPQGAINTNVKSNILLMLDISGSMNDPGNINSLPASPRDIKFNTLGYTIIAEDYGMIKIYNRTGSLINSWTPTDSATNPMATRSIALDSSDNIYVIADFSPEIRKYSSEGVVDSSFNLTIPESSLNDSGYYVKDIEIDKDNNIYIVDGQGIVMKFDSTGNLLTTWSNIPAINLSIASDDFIYISTTDNQIKKYTSSGVTTNLAPTVGGISLDAQAINIYVDNIGNIYASLYYVDTSGTTLGTVQKYSATGNLITNYPTIAISPTSLAQASDGLVWITDEANNIVVNTSGGTLPLEVDSSNSKFILATNAIKSVINDDTITSRSNFGYLEWSSNSRLVQRIEEGSSAAISNTLDNTSPDGETNLAGALDLARSYFLGPDSPRNPDINCQENILMVISDGEWNTPSGETPQQIADNLYKQYKIKTFIVGFFVNENSNYVTLAQSGGTYPDAPIYATSTQELIDTLSTYITKVNENNLTFAPPTIIPGLGSGDSIVQSVFKHRSRHQWKGHLYRYSLDSNGDIGDLMWDAGDKLNLRHADDRSIWTVNDNLENSSLNNFTLANIGNLTPVLNLNSAPDYNEAQITKLINFFRGKDSYNEYTSALDEDNISLIRGERWKLADIYNSRAVYVGAPRASASLGRPITTEDYYRASLGYSEFQKSNLCGTSECINRKKVIYAGGNDGMLHAFNLIDGAELWAFIPPSLLPKLPNVISQQDGRSISIFGIDGQLAIKDIYNSTDTSWHTILIGGLRQGGNSYYALDVTNPDAPKHLFTFASYPEVNKVIYWNADGTKTIYNTNNTIPDEYNYSGLGQSWSTPVILNIPIAGVRKWVAAIAGGYNNGVNTTDGAKLFIIDLEDGGKIIKKIAIPDTDSTNNITNSVPPEVTVIDSNSTINFTNQGALLYFTDLEGKLWEVNLIDNNDLYVTTKLFDAESTNTNGRYCFNKTAASITNTGLLYQFFGTGNMNNIDETSSTIQNRFYAIKDTSFPNFSLKTMGTVADLFNATSNTVPTSTTDVICPLESQLGWYIDLDNSEKVVAKPVLFNNNVMVTRYNPNNSDVCSLGSSRLTEHNFTCGSLSRDTILGQGFPTEPVIYQNKIYIGFSGPDDTSGNSGGTALPPGFTKKNNIITGTPPILKPGQVTSKSWWEIF